MGWIEALFAQDRFSSPIGRKKALPNVVHWQGETLVIAALQILQDERFTHFGHVANLLPASLSTLRKKEIQVSLAQLCYSAATPAF